MRNAKDRCGSVPAGAARLGSTLVEVLVALVVLTVGLTSVIALFPVGINRVRNAVLDTRTTQMAQEAKETFVLKRMYNDPTIINWNAYDVAYYTAYAAALGANPQDPAAAADAAETQAAPILDQYADSSLVPYNLMAWIPYSPVIYGGSPPLNVANPVYRGLYLSAEGEQVPFDVSQVPAPQIDDGRVTNASPGFDMSYPVLLDPWLFDHMGIQLQMLNGLNALAGVPRINISSPLSNAPVAPPGFKAYAGYYNVVAGAAFPYCDISVVSVYDVAGFPLTGAYQNVAAFERNAAKTRWFTSLSDVTFYADRPGEVRNPSGKDFLSPQLAAQPLQPIHYYEPFPYVPPGYDPNTQNLLVDPSSRATAERNYEYSWAAMFQRSLSPDFNDDVVDPATGQVTNPGTPEVGRPNVRSRDFSGKLAVMCFYKRNLNSPYSVLEGCFYNGSRKVTLSWPANAGLNIPEIEFGTWLCEVSVARDTVGGQSLGACNRHSGVYTTMDATVDTDGDGNLDTAIVKRHYRRAFAFYKVIEVISGPETLVSGGATRTFMEVIVDRPARGYPLRYAQPDLADSRPIDPYRIPQWPMFDRLDLTLALNPAASPSILSPQFDDETNDSQAQATGVAGYSQYYPVVIFDGLREVFEYEF